MARLGDIGAVITGNTPKTSDSENYVSNDICFVKPSDISDSEITYLQSSEFFISDSARCKARIAPENSILVTCIGIIGKVAINQVECAFNQQINAVIPDINKCLSNYVAYAIESQKDIIQGIANAAVVPIINKSQFSNIEIPLPSLDTQRHIATVLDKVSDLIALRKQQLAKLDELVKARFVEMFGNVMTYKPMSDICSIITDGTHQPPNFVTGGIPFIFVSNIVGNKISYNAEKFISLTTYNELIKRTPIEIGDVLLSTVGSYGHPAVVKSDQKFLFQRHIAYLKPRHDLINSDYLHGAILAPNAQKQIEAAVKGIAQKTLNLSEIKKMTIPVPPIKQQKQFAAYVEQVDRSKAIVRQGLDKLKTLKKALMQEYFG